MDQPEGPYTGLTQQVIDITVQRMSRPEEVMVMENEDGEVVRVETKDTDGIALYKTMKECLVMLVSVDYTITEAIFMNYLDIQVRAASCVHRRCNCRRRTPSATRCSLSSGRSARSAAC